MSMDESCDSMNAESEKLLGADAKNRFEHRCKTFPKESLHLPGSDFIERSYAQTDRPTPVLRSLAQIFDHGRLAGTGYLSILPVDQGGEHSAGASFGSNYDYSILKTSSRWQWKAAALAKREERDVSQKLPHEYAAYKARVPAFIPRFGQKTHPRETR